MGISVDTLADYVDQALGTMTAIVTGLGDEAANTRPSLPGANSPYVILRHCLGVVEYWGGHMIAGRPVQRDRDAEFRSSGPVAALAAAARETARQFRTDLQAADPAAPPRGTHPTVSPSDLEMTSQGHALLHIAEEVYQHLGHLEITRDILVHQQTPQP
jgi:hypothetical protein